MNSKLFFDSFLNVEFRFGVILKFIWQIGSAEGNRIIKNLNTITFLNEKKYKYDDEEKSEDAEIFEYGNAQKRAKNPFFNSTNEF